MQNLTTFRLNWGKTIPSKLLIVQYFMFVTRLMHKPFIVPSLKFICILYYITITCAEGILSFYHLLINFTDSLSNSLPVVVFDMSSSNSSDNFRWNHLRTLFAFRSSKNRNWNIKLNAMVGLRFSISGEWMLANIAWNRNDEHWY